MNKIFFNFTAALITALILLGCTNRNGEKQSSATEDKVLRVMAYNIHHANPPSQPDSIDIEAIAQIIRDQDPDLVALQEVDVNIERSGNIDQAQEIAEILNMQVFFAKAIDYKGGEYGVAILSRYPLSEQTVHKLPMKANTKVEQRVLATVKISLPDGSEIRFGSTHLDYKKDPVNRKIQMNRITELAAEEKLPFIIAGDFNAVPDSEVIGMLDNHFQRTCMKCPPTIPVEHPERTIDFIAFKHPEGKFKVVNHKVLDEKYASDHLPVISEIKYH